MAGIAPGFRDVEQRNGALQGSETARGEDAASEAPSVQSEVEAAGSAESFESFEDVVSAVEEADASEAEPIPSPEPVDAPEPLHEPEAVRRVEPAAPPEGAHGSSTPPEPAEPETIDSVSPGRDEELERPRTRRRKISFF